MNRAHWQALAEERIVAAQALLAAQQWSSAYYLAGYAVECGLKSCILVHLAANPSVIFEEKRFSEKCWSHNIDGLVNLADIETARDADIAANPVRGQSWLAISEWNETSRYEFKTQVEAWELFNAITDNANGVMPWIRLRW